MLLAQVDPDARVVGRIGAHAEDFAGVDVHRDERTGQAALGERRFARFLHCLVHRQLQVVSRDRRGRGELAARGGLTHRVDLVAGRPRRPAQVVVVAVLEAFLADDFARFDPFVGTRFGDLFFVHLAGVAEDLRRLVFLRVVADEDFFHRHAGVFPLVFFDVVDEVVADALADRQRRPRRDDFLFFLHHFQDLRQFHVDEFADFFELGVLRRFFFRQLRGVDLQRQAGPVVDQHFAVVVEDLAARGDDFGRAGAIALRLGEVFGAFEDLQVPEAEEEDPEERDGEAADHGDPQRHAVGPGPILRSQVHVPKLPARSVVGCDAPSPRRPAPGAPGAACRRRAPSR